MSEKHTQTKAQRLAEIQEREWPAPSPKEREQTAAELRRLHEANQELLTELKKFTNAMTACMDWPDTTGSMLRLVTLAESARAAITKVEGQ